MWQQGHQLTKGLFDVWRCLAGPPDDEAIELAFSKKKIEERKAWLAGFEPGTYLDQSVDQISYSDFVNKVRNGSVPVWID